ncbi:MAG: hypothetical protein V4805_11400, partial [Pseudomonadota bacterium]
MTVLSKQFGLGARIVPSRLLALCCGLIIATSAGSAAASAPTAGRMVPVLQLLLDDNYQNTKDNIPVRRDHPRTYITAPDLAKQVKSCYGPSAKLLCKNIFQTGVINVVSTAISGGKYLGLPEYLMYLATGDEAYNQRAEIAVKADIDAALLTAGGGFHPISENDLLAIDIYWPRLSREYKLKFLEAIQKNNYFYSGSHVANRASTFGYHDAYSRHDQLAAALIAWDDPILSDSEVLANPQKYRQWDLQDFIYASHRQASPGGKWVTLENYLAGDPTFNPALPGTKGGLYDNFGYDNSEESNSVMINMLLKHGTGRDYHLNNLRDRNKGVFWQSMRIPHNGWMSNLWNTQSSQTVSTMGRSPELSHMYRDGRLKYFAKELLEGADYNIPKISAILYYDFNDEVAIKGPQDLPLSTYFSGGGIVASRANWSDSAAFGTFISGEHVSRRYSDINTFSLDRKSTITGVAGARYRNSLFNGLHHDVYTHLSNSKNTLKVCDPNETVDFSNTGVPLAVGAGKKIHADANFCGQIPSGYTLTATDNTQTGSKKELEIGDIQNMGDITRFEHVNGQYAYALGNGRFNYSGKVKNYERAFVHLFPDTFVTFDRVETSDPNFKTSILIHTHDALNATRAPDATGEGLKQWNNQNELIFDNGIDKAVFQTLLPKARSSKVRGGTSYISKNAVLNTGVPLAIGHNFATPRYLELSAYDPANFTTLSGTTLTIIGNSTAQDNDTEVVTFTGTAKEQYV